MPAVHIDKSNFEANVINSGIPVLVDFWAEWCGPCKMVAPALDTIADESAGRLTVAKVNIDDQPELATRFGIRSIPTLALFKDGKVSDVKVGAMSKGAIAAWLAKAA